MDNYQNLTTTAILTECEFYVFLISGQCCGSSVQWENLTTHEIKTTNQWRAYFRENPPDCSGADTGGTVTNVSSVNGDITVANPTTTPQLTLVQAPALRSATTTVNVSSATAPTSGQVLTATGANAATWQTPATVPTALSGTYTPTIAKTLNVSTATAQQLTYMRVGNMVTVSGQCSITASGAGLTTGTFSLPIASDFSTIYQAGGSGAGLTGTGSFAVTCQANATTNAVEMTYMAPSGAALTITFTFSYEVI